MGCASVGWGGSSQLMQLWGGPEGRLGLDAVPLADAQEILTFCWASPCWQAQVYQLQAPAAGPAQRSCSTVHQTPQQCRPCMHSRAASAV